MTELLYEQLTYKILGACFDVYKKMGCGFLEAVYQECLELEFQKQGIAFLSQPELSLTYGDIPLKQKYIPDFICYDKIIVEIKALATLNNENEAQVHNYLHATGLRVGLLVNFGHYPKAEHKRIII